MVKKILQLDFVLSKWFAGKKKNNRVIPGAIVLFLFKVMFLDLVVYSLIAKRIELTKDVSIYVITLMLQLSFLLFGLEKPLKQMIGSEGLERRYKAMSKSEIQKKNGHLLYLCLFFLLSSCGGP